MTNYFDYKKLRVSISMNLQGVMLIPEEEYMLYALVKNRSSEATELLVHANSQLRIVIRDKYKDKIILYEDASYENKRKNNRFDSVTFTLTPWGEKQEEFHIPFKNKSPAAIRVDAPEIFSVGIYTNPLECRKHWKTLAPRLF